MMEIRKTVKEFVETIQEGKMTASELIAVKKYISAAEKVRLAKDVLDFSAEYDRGFIKFDSFKKHLTFTFAVIEAHTNLVFADEWADKMHEYDMLCEHGLLDTIISSFEEDYVETLDVVDMMCGDMLADNSIEASVAKLAQSISENLDVFVGALSDKLEELDIEKIIPKDLDLNKLMGLLNKIK